MLPACARSSFPNLVLTHGLVKYRPSAPSIALASLTSGLALGAVVAAGAAGLLLRRRRRQALAGGAPAQRDPEGQQLLAEEGSDSSAQQSEANNRRAHISRLLHQRLGVTNRSIKMQTISGLPARLTHKLGPSGAGLAELELQPLGLGADGRRGSGLPREAVQAWVSSGTSVTPERKWRLDTRSMQLAASELEVRWAGGVRGRARKGLGAPRGDWAGLSARLDASTAWAALPPHPHPRLSLRCPTPHHHSL